MEFARGEQLWLRGKQVVFMRYERAGTAVVRSLNATDPRVVSAARLARSQRESLHADLPARSD